MQLRLGDTEFTEGWIDYPGVGKITDKEVADYVIKHTTLFDRLFRPRKIVYASLLSQNVLMQIFPDPKKKNWKY